MTTLRVKVSAGIAHTQTHRECVATRSHSSLLSVRKGFLFMYPFRIHLSVSKFISLRVLFHGSMVLFLFTSFRFQVSQILWVQILRFQMFRCSDRFSIFRCSDFQNSDSFEFLVGLVGLFVVSMIRESSKDLFTSVDPEACVCCSLLFFRSLFHRARSMGNVSEKPSHHVCWGRDVPL